jgi:hypothetical protein
MEEIHKIREEFYQETKGKDPEHVLKLIKEGGAKTMQELKEIKPDPRLIVERKYRPPESDLKEEIRHIRERKRRYGR